MHNSKEKVRVLTKSRNTMDFLPGPDLASPSSTLRGEKLKKLVIVDQTNSSIRREH